jgi:hypothetical protein
MKRILFLFFSSFPLLTGSIAMAYEQPEYRVVRQAEEYEIRVYEPYLVAEVDVAGDFDDAGNQAFRLLADYIFGANRAQEKMSMTAPVESRPSDRGGDQGADEGERMNMTAPVSSASKDANTYTYAFVMERKYTKETLPEPVNPAIRIRELPARTMAVRRFSGFWSESNYDRNEKALLEAVAADGLRAVGEPVFARYNAPFMPWFLRRNEVMVEIEGE